MKKFLLAGAALIAISMSVPAMAADMPVKAYTPEPVHTWTGWYIGINGGYVWGRTDTGVSATNNVPAFFAFGNISTVNQVGSNPIKNSGGIAGGQVGYLVQSGSVARRFRTRV